MKNLISIFLSVILFMGVTSCMSGYRYADSPAMEFSDFNYGFPVKLSKAEPRIAYIDEGSGSKTIILVHGLASNAGFWRYNIAELSKEYRVIAIDLPGYGRSQKADKFSYSMPFFADAVNQLITELKLGKVVYVGHSMGGQIGLTLAMNHPEVLDQLILAAPAGFEPFARGEGDWLKSVITIEGVKTTNEEGIRRNLASNFYNWRDDLEWMVEERARMAKAVEFDDFAYTVTRSVTAMVDQPTVKKLDKITLPVTIIHGEFDGLIPNPYLHPGVTHDVYLKAVGHLPNYKIVTIPDAGHMIQIEKSAEFDAAVLNALK